MEPFARLTAVTAPLDLPNLDTDRILPARFLRRPRGAGYAPFLPDALLAAAHDDVRLSPDALHLRALDLSAMLIAVSGNKIGLTASSRFVRVADYIGRELERVLDGKPSVLGRTRLSLWESVKPMSLHLGVIRIGDGQAPLVDVLYDTTDSMPNLRAFCSVAYHPTIDALLKRLQTLLPLVTPDSLGAVVQAF